MRSLVLLGALFGALVAYANAGSAMGFAGPPAPIDHSNPDFDDHQQPQIPPQNDDYNNHGTGGYGKPNGGYGRPNLPPVVEQPYRPNGGYGRPDTVVPPRGGYGRADDIPPPVDTGYQRGGYGRPRGGYGRPDVPVPPVYGGNNGPQVPYNPNGHYAGPYGVPNYG